MMTGPNPALRCVPALALLAGLAACDAARSTEQLQPPPPEVVASFRQFSDSMIPRLQDTLFRTGFRHHDPEAGEPSSAPVTLRGETPAVSAADARAELYEGVISGEMQRNGEVILHWPIALHFARVPGTSKWVLLTSSGYPDDGQPRTPASAPRLPALAMAAMMPQFKDLQEWQAWWTLGDKRRAAASRKK